MSDIPPYWTQPEESKFEVSIASIRQFDDYYHIRINENVIRAAGGGQAGDRGRLIVGEKRVEVTDTITDAEGLILVASKAVDEGAVGHLEIDMDWRTSMMKNHTAEHLFVSIFKNENKNIDVGELWIDGKHGTVELLGENLDLDRIFLAEKEVRRIIEQDIPVKSEFVDSRSIDPSVRSREGLKEKYSKLRIVHVGDMDSSACSGIHVASTGKIGFFKVVDVKTSEKSTRVEFLTGVKAAEIVSDLYNVILQRKYTYPFEMEQLGTVLDRAKTTVDDKRRLIEKTTKLIVDGSSIEQIGEVIFRYEYLPGYDSGSLRKLANQFSMSKPTIILLFAPGTKSQLILRVNEMSKDASDLISEPVLNLGGKGGGKGDVFTGGFVGVEDPLKLFENLVSEVRKLIA